MLINRPRGVQHFSGTGSDYQLPFNKVNIACGVKFGIRSHRLRQGESMTNGTFREVKSLINC